jgi:hypothetical protein
MRDSLIGAMSHVYQFLDPRSRLLVVALHRAGGHSPISPESIKQQLRFVAEHYEVIRPCQFDRVDRHQQLAMITIDDGHADTYCHIFPLAKSFGIPIIVCSSTDFLLRGKWLWFDRFDWAVDHARPGAEFRIGETSVRIGDAPQLAAFRSRLKRLRPPERESVLQQACDAWGADPPAAPPEEYRALSRAELTQMLRSGLLELCGHTVTHTIATVLPDAELEWELKESKRELEELTGQAIAAFCYPNGGDGDFNQRTEQRVREAGYTMALTSIEGLNWSDKCRAMTLKRVHVHERCAVFMKDASGLGDVQRSLRHRRSASNPPPPALG